MAEFIRRTNGVFESIFPRLYTQMNKSEIQSKAESSIAQELSHKFERIANASNTGRPKSTMWGIFPRFQSTSERDVNFPRCVGRLCRLIMNGNDVPGLVRTGCRSVSVYRFPSFHCIQHSQTLPPFLIFPIIHLKIPCPIHHFTLFSL